MARESQKSNGSLGDFDPIRESRITQERVETMKRVEARAENIAKGVRIFMGSVIFGAIATLAAFGWYTLVVATVLLARALGHL